MMKTAFALSLLAAAAPARAHEPAPWVMPDLTPESRVGAELMVGTMTFADATLGRLELSGQFLVARRLLVTALVPIAYASSDLLGGNAVGLGNLTAGLRFTSTSARPGGGLLRAGLGANVSLPTASDDGDAGAAAALNALFFIPDIGRYLPFTTTIRLHGDLRREGAGLFVQAQLGLDLLLIEDDEEDLSLIRLGLAGGFAFSPHVAGVLELTTLSLLLEDNGEDADDFVHTLDLGLRYHDARVIAGARVYLPLDDQLRDNDMLGFAIDAGARF